MPDITTRRSARGIIIRAGHVALIERRRSGEHFYVAPGGSVEPGESSAEALVREIQEELGLLVEPVRIVAEVTFPDRIQLFWLADIRGGQFGTGTGLEMTERPTDAYGTYRPIWMPIAEVFRHSVRPARIATILVESVAAGWPTTPLTYAETDMWWLPSPHPTTRIL